MSDHLPNPQTWSKTVISREDWNKTKHSFEGISGSIECSKCGLDYRSHTNDATCMHCGSENRECHILASFSFNPKRLVCYACYTELMNAAVRIAKEKADKMTLADIKSPGDYYVSNNMAIKKIIDDVNNDHSIINKSEAICELVQARIFQLRESIFELNREAQKAQGEKDEAQRFFQSEVKKLDLAAQERFQKENIEYKPGHDKKEKKPKSPIKPSTRITAKEQNRVDELVNRFHLKEEHIRLMMKINKCDPDKAASILIKSVSSAETASTNESSNEVKSIGETK